MYLLLKRLSYEMAVYLLFRRVTKWGASSTQLPATSPTYIHQSSSLLLPSARYYYRLPLVSYLLTIQTVYRYFFHIYLQCSGSGSASIRIDFALLGIVDPDPEQGTRKFTKINKLT